MPPRDEDSEATSLSATTIATKRRSSFTSLFHVTRRRYRNNTTTSLSTNNQRNAMTSNNGSKHDESSDNTDHENNENITLNFSLLELENCESHSSQKSQFKFSNVDVTGPYATSHSKSTNSLSNVSTAPTTTSNTVSSSSTSKPRKSVSFEALHIRTFIRIIGDHPCCSTGLPLTFGWNPVEETTIKLEDYETSRTARRSRQDMKLNDKTRRDILNINCCLRSLSSTGSDTSEDDSSSDMNDVDSSLSSLSLPHDEIISSIDLKRAERRLYRSRQRSRRRIIANNFFQSPIE
jgi:hypothetical protein